MPTAHINCRPTSHVWLQRGVQRDGPVCGGLVERDQKGVDAGRSARRGLQQLAPRHHTVVQLQAPRRESCAQDDACTAGCSAGRQKAVRPAAFLYTPSTLLGPPARCQCTRRCCTAAWRRREEGGEDARNHQHAAAAEIAARSRHRPRAATMRHNADGGASYPAVGQALGRYAKTLAPHGHARGHPQPFCSCAQRQA